MQLLEHTFISYAGKQKLTGFPAFPRSIYEDMEKGGPLTFTLTLPPLPSSTVYSANWSVPLQTDGHTGSTYWNIVLRYTSAAR